MHTTHSSSYENFNLVIHTNENYQIIGIYNNVSDYKLTTNLLYSLHIIDSRVIAVIPVKAFFPNAPSGFILLQSIGLLVTM